jgi:hypothetical protein
MTAENTPYGKLSFRRAFAVILILTGLLLMSSWADRKAADVEGPSRLVRGPHDTIYVQVDRNIAKVSSEGELISVLDLDTDASVPDVADFFVEQDGRLLIARRDSLLRYYSPEGKPLAAHARRTSPLLGENPSCSLTKDPATGMLYFADTSRHRIEVFGPDGKEVKTITVPSGAPESSLIGYRTEELDLERVYSTETPLQYPSGLTFANDRLIVADTDNSRIVLFHPDGTLDRIIPMFPLESSGYIDPVKVDRFDDAIYVVVRSRSFIGGRVQSFEFNTGLPRDFRYAGSSDPRDILGRRDDVLVADRSSLSILRYAHTGRFLGAFGKPDLQGLYAASRLKRKTYEWIGKGSLAAMAAVIAWLIFTSAGRFTERRDILGPLRSARRRLLLLVPGLGQAAAGRPLRAVILLLIFLYFAVLFIYFLLQHRSHANASQSLPMLVTTGLMAYSIWVFIVLDGIRLTGKPADSEGPSKAKRRSYAAIALLITVCSAGAAQMAREFIVQGWPGASPAIRQLFDLLIAPIHGYFLSASASALPASIVFGWGGAIAALFGTLAWQAKARHEEIATGIVVGFLAGMYSWLLTVVITGNGLGWMLYAPPIQGALLGLFTYLYFRRKGMPALIMPAAVAGAWLGYFLRFFFGVLAHPIGKLLSAGDTGGFWTGAIARLELIVIPALFIHLAIWATWNIAADRPTGDAEVVIRSEDGYFVSSCPERQTPVES